MTLPTPRLPEGWLAWPAAAAALLFLNASLTFGNVWPTPKIRWESALSIELALCVLLLAAGGRIRRTALRVLPAVWMLLVAGRYLDVTGPGLYGRKFNLYWDSRHLANVVEMISEAAPAWLIALVLIAAIGGLAGAYVISRAALTCTAAALAKPRLGAAVVVAAVTVCAMFAGHLMTGREAGVVFADPVTPSYARQARSVLAMVGPGALAPVLADSPVALLSPPGDLQGADVHLVFVESYGAITFDSPALASALGPSRAGFEAAVRETGRQVVSAYVESPTFGASSWLAHLSLMSGVAVRDQDSYQVLMTQRRETLATTFSRAGYRAVALMPGMRQAWPEGEFYGYDRIYGRDDLQYAGPRFGWWSIPDQYALAKLDAIEGPHSSRRPLFVVFPTSTTHAPFGPVAPYQPDWSKVLTTDAYDAAEVERVLAHPPDLTDLAPDYARAMSYEFTTFAGYLRERPAGELVMILVGDHQPPSAVSGRGAPWTVPVHIVSDRPEIIGRLLALGFRQGLTPSRPALGGMHELVPMLLAAFSADEN